VAQVISVSNQKGGTGKTTTAVNLAAGLALRGQRTLLIDLDPQGNATYALTCVSEFNVTAYDLLVNDRPVRSAILRSRQPDLDLIPADIDLAGAEIELVSAIGSQTLLGSKLRSERLPYNYIVIDCPPSLGLLTINALAATHEVIIPVSLSAFALKGLERLLETITKVRTRLGRTDLAIGGVLVTFWERTNVARDVYNLLRENFGDKLFTTPIPKSVKLEEANARHMSIFEYDAGSPGALAYACVVDEILAGNGRDESHKPIIETT